MLLIVCVFISVVSTLKLCKRRYAISVADGDVPPYFPFISDTGNGLPERGIFSLICNVSSFLSKRGQLKNSKQVCLKFFPLISNMHELGDQTLSFDSQF